jgi:SAM-dependent methyltransferase
MLEWTGERFLPWLREPALAYEHLHRYAYAANLVRGKRVLDLASGEGYGADLLARQASAVIGVDIDPDAVAHAGARYGNRGVNVQFLTAPITNIPIPDDHSFDAAVCFEAIEHIDDHEGLLREVKRLLKPDGLFIVSTPNKIVYRDHAGEQNPFHVRELSFEEFKVLLQKHFRFLRFLGQHIHPQSVIWPIGNETAAHQDFTITHNGDEFTFISNDERIPLYLIALASNDETQLSAMASGLVDESDMLLKEKDRVTGELLAGKSALEEALSWREKQVEESIRSLQSYETSMIWKDEQIRQLNDGIEWLRDKKAEFEQTIDSNNQALAWRAEQVASYQLLLESAQPKLDQLQAIQSSRGWKLILRMRRIRDTLSGLLRFRS